MSFGFIARGVGYGLAGPSAITGSSSCILAGRPSLIRVCWFSFGAWLLGWSKNYACPLLADFPPLLCIEIGS